MLLEFMWSKPPRRSTNTGDTLATQREAITAQQPEAIAFQQDTRADGLTAKTLFASEIMAANKAWTEKEVSLRISFKHIYIFSFNVLKHPITLVLDII
jgi:ABC-type hemin transport system substrate-binding protein